MPLKEVIAEKKTRKHALSWYEKDVFWLEFYLEAFATTDQVACKNQYEMCDFLLPDEWPILFFILEQFFSLFTSNVHYMILSHSTQFEACS